MNELEPDRKLDQFFLKDEKIIEKEIELAMLSSEDVVLEIGAGLGNITKKISEKCKVIAVEKDRRFIPYLKKISNANVIHGDILNVMKHEKRYNKIIGNIPYSISQKILLEILRNKWDRCILITQKEFAKKIQSGDKLSLLVQDCAYFEIVKTVPDHAFYPKAITSSIIVMEQKKIMDEKFWLFLRDIFRSKNKNVSKIFKKSELKKKIHQLSLEEAKELYQNN